MKTRVDTWKIECNFCGKTEIFYTARGELAIGDLPEGWDTVYFRLEYADRCPTCKAAKRGEDF